MKHKQVNSFNECLEYVNRLGIINPTKPIGWRQNDLVAIVHSLETASEWSGTKGTHIWKPRHNNVGYPKAYPFTVKFLRRNSEGSRVLRFYVNGRLVEMQYPKP